MIGSIADSVAPARVRVGLTTIAAAASPMAWVPVAQAELGGVVQAPGAEHGGDIAVVVSTSHCA